MNTGFTDFSNFVVKIPVVLRWIICVSLIAFSVYVCWKLLPIHGEIVTDKAGQNYLVLDGKETLRYILFFAMTILLSSINLCFVSLFAILCPLAVEAAEKMQSAKRIEGKSKKEIKASEDMQFDLEGLILENETKEIKLAERNNALLEKETQLNSKSKKLSEQEMVLTQKREDIINAQKEISIAKEKIKNQRFKLKRLYGEKFEDHCDKKTAEDKITANGQSEWQLAKVKTMFFDRDKNYLILESLIKNKKHRISMRLKNKTLENTRAYNEFLQATGFSEFDIEAITGEREDNFLINLIIETNNRFKYDSVLRRKIKKVRHVAKSFRSLPKSF